MARLFLMGACLLFASLPFAAAAGPFEDDVDAAIADGVRWLRDQQAFTGEALDLSQARGLALLVLVESMPGSYAAADAGDQALAREAVQRILTNPDVGVPRAFYVYFHAVNLLGLSAYIRAGGPEIDGAPFTLRGALEKLTDETLAAQSLDGATAGFWGYVGPGNDSSATQYAAAALAAARGTFRAMGDAAALARVDAIDASLALTALGYAAHPEPDGGMKYRFDAFYHSSFQQTAASLWCQLLGGMTLADPTAQGAMRWLADRYNYSTSEGYRDFWRVSYAYYLWTSAKAYLLVEQGAGGAAPGDVGPADLGLLPANPAPNATFGDVGRLVRREPG
ncbi:MAG: hypothetical protein KC549_13430, partial [Myxococcales bacterium]|nr:hypothetical protein [Myxococcales bacterium]